MNDDQREQVRSNARYLREVRPIDPEEISDYVEGQPHPAVVRQVLRECALELDLREREDGTFVPVETGPLQVAFDGVEAFPEPHARRLEDLLVERLGAGWPDGETGDRLRERIRAFKTAYFAGEAVEYDETTALAYAVYHLPDFYAAVQYVLADLARDGLLDRRLRVLDVGAGVGGPALGLSDLVDRDEAGALLEYHAVEPSAAADVLDHLLAGTGPNVHATVHRERAEAFAPEGTYDLLLFANVFGELDDPVAVARRYLEHLADGGALVALAPADRGTATGLRTIERTLEHEAGVTVYAPTVRLWPGQTPRNREWSFDVRPDLAVPGFQRRLDEAAVDSDHEAGEFTNVDVQFAYSVLRADGRRAVEFTPDRGRLAKMAEMRDHVTERIDLAAIKLSHRLDEGGESNPLFLVGDGSQRTDHYAVCTQETALNRDLLAAGYGDLLVFENVLVLWNDDERAFNLVVDDETVVDRVPT